MLCCQASPNGSKLCRSLTWMISTDARPGIPVSDRIRSNPPPECQLQDAGKTHIVDLKASVLCRSSICDCNGLNTMDPHWQIAFWKLALTAELVISTTMVTHTRELTFSPCNGSSHPTIFSMRMWEYDKSRILSWRENHVVITQISVSSPPDPAGTRQVKKCLKERPASAQSNQPDTF